MGLYIQTVNMDIDIQQNKSVGNGHLGGQVTQNDRLSCDSLLMIAGWRLSQLRSLITEPFSIKFYRNSFVSGHWMSAVN